MGGSSDHGRSADLSQAADLGGGPPQVMDRLAYMADLLAEMRAMARDDGHETLESLLALAHAEARRRVA